MQTDENLHEWIEIKVKKNTLVLDITDNNSVQTKKGIHITVQFEDIIETKAFETELIGSADIDLTIQTSTAKV